MYGIMGLIVAACIAAMTFPAVVFFIPIYLYFYTKGAAERAVAVENKVTTLLMGNETLINSALEVRLNSLFGRRRLVAITNSRVLFVNRNILGGYVMKDHQWKDLIDVKLSENIFPRYFGSTLHFKFSNEPAEDIFISGMPTTKASEIYTVAQREEHSWEEKRRIRTIEESRAKAGGVHITNTPSHTGSVSGSKIDISDEILSIKKLLDNGTISDAEYEELKTKILNKYFI